MCNVLTDINIKETSRKEKRESGFYDKYNRAGVYCIYIDERLCYIGSSIEMNKRIGQHLRAIGKDKSYKYRILREAHNKGYKISFDVLYYTPYAEKSAQIDILKKERIYIEQYDPPLNHELPWGGRSKQREPIPDKPWYTLDHILKQPKGRLKSAYLPEREEG